MFVSVVICSCRDDSYPSLLDAVASLRNQTYHQMEIIVVIDGNEELHRKVTATYRDQPDIRIVAPAQSLGVSGARDLGLKGARGDIIAFIDDDAAAEKGWVEGLVNTCREHDALAVAGPVLPVWLSGRPDFLPEELFWLVGLTYEGYAEGGIGEVRNALGSNMGFKREVFARVGGFSQGFGFASRGNSYVQGEEPELALRIKAVTGRGVVYNPGLVVYHKVQERKTKLAALFRRAFYQGYSKALIKRVSPSSRSLDTEKSYLAELLSKYIPRRFKTLFLERGRVTGVKQLLFLSVSIIMVGLGFIYGFIRPLPSRLVAARGFVASDDVTPGGSV
jgi:GT2 family glycosyltransferase